MVRRAIYRIRSKATQTTIADVSSLRAVVDYGIEMAGIGGGFPFMSFMARTSSSTSQQLQQSVSASVDSKLFGLSLRNCHFTSSEVGLRASSVVMRFGGGGGGSRGSSGGSRRPPPTSDEDDQALDISSIK